MILGIDPGMSGGIALLHRSGVIAFAEAMPVLRNAVATVDVRRLGEWLRAAGATDIFAFVERAQAYPRQGISSAFNYGVIFGSVLTAIADLGIGYELVAPAKWKRDFGLTADKREAVQRVQQMYPRFPVKRSEDGIAEAILIARWGLKQLAAVAA